MKNMKRILCALISVVMLIGMLPVSAGAAPAAMSLQITKIMTY